MNFNLTDEQRMIQESARRFVVEHYAGNRASTKGGDGAVDNHSWLDLAEHGFLSIGQPEIYGGIGGPVEIAIVCEEFGRGPILEPYIGSAVFASQVISRAGTEQQKALLLPAIASGKSIISVAYRDAESAGDEQEYCTTARHSSGGYILTGRKGLVLEAPAANLLIVSAVIGDGERSASDISLFLVDPLQDGVTVKPVRLVDGSWCGEIYFDGVRLPAENLLGAEGLGATGLRAGLRYATLGVCSEISGLSAGSLEATAQYLKTRKQFGAPLSSFQALRHRIADMAIDCEMAKASVLKLIASFQAPDQHDPEMTLSLAKVMLDEIGHRVCSQAIQLHGAMGLTEECGIGRYYARSTLIRSLYGSTSAHFTNYSQLLVARLEEARNGTVSLTHQGRDRELTT